MQNYSVIPEHHISLPEQCGLSPLILIQTRNQQHQATGSRVMACDVCEPFVQTSAAERNSSERRGVSRKEEEPEKLQKNNMGTCRLPESPEGVY